MPPDELHAEREQALRRRLQKFNGRTRRRAAVLVDWEELAGSVDPATSSGNSWTTGPAWNAC